MNPEESFAVLMNGGGAHPDPFNAKDIYYVPKIWDTLPPFKDLREEGSSSICPIYDQGKTMSCTANAVAAAIWYEVKQQRLAAQWSDEGPSRRFIYWNARVWGKQEGVRVVDKGTHMRVAVDALAKKGVCSEGDCKFPDFRTINEEIDAAVKALEYDENTATIKRTEAINKIVNEEPKPIAFDHGAPHKITSFRRLDADLPDHRNKELSFKAKEKFGLDNLQRLRHCLSEGFPVAFSFWYYLNPAEAFITEKPTWVLKDIWNDEKSSDKGKFPPHIWIDQLEDKYRWRQNGEPAKPGHSVIAIGYDDVKRQVLIQNSYGLTWGGGNGLFYMPYAWISDFAATCDFWTIRVDDERLPGILWHQLEEFVLGSSSTSATV